MRASAKSMRQKMPGWLTSWVRDSGINLLSQAGVTIVTTILVMLLARRLPKDELGLFFGVFGAAQGLAIFVDIGMATWLLRELSAAVEAERFDTEGRTVSAVLANCGVLNLLLAAATVIFAVAVGASASLVPVLVALVVYFGLVATAINAETVLRSRREIWLVAVSNLTEKFVILAGVLIAFATSGSLGAIALAYLVGGVVRLTIPLVLVARRLSLVRPRFADMTNSIKRSIPIGFSAASMSLIARFDVAAVGVISTIAAASFAIGDRVVSALLVIPLAASVTLYPFFARPESRNSRTFLTITALFFVAGTALTAVAIVLAPTLVPLIFGDKYEDSVTTVQIMLGVVPFVFAGGALVATLYSLRRELRVALTAGPAVVIGLVAVIAGQLAFGSEGAAAGYLARQILIVAGLTIQLFLVLRIPGALEVQPDVDTEQLIVEEEIASGI